MPSLRTLLVLSRASNLPTVWSNCLAAWWLGGAGSYGSLPALFLGASLLYIGGMFLNDAVDADFDRQHRRERPIPSGQISERLAWQISFGLLLAGALCLVALAIIPQSSRHGSTGRTSSSSVLLEANQGPAAPELRAASNGPALPTPDWNSGSDSRQTDPLASQTAPFDVRRTIITTVLTAALVGLIVIYDLLHKAVNISPILMGSCRALLFLAAASLGQDGVNGLVVWCALALGFYVAGLSYFARIERMLRRPEWWPCLLLAVPVALAVVVNAGEFRRDALLLSLILGLWIVRNVRQALAVSQQNVSRAVTGLLAGIVFVDLLAVCGAPRELSFVFLGLFGATLLFQKFIPAT